MNFDNKKDVEDYIHDLKALHEVADYRYNQGYNLHNKLSSFKIFNNQIWFDTCGNMMIRTEQDSVWNRYSPITVPYADDRCPYCGKAFSVYDLMNIVTTSDGKYYHKICNRYNNLDLATNEFKDIFSKIYNLHEIDFRAIPNQYDDWEGYKPWFIVTTPDGKIKIGWRKRVINIEWLDDYKQFSEQFKDEDTTCDFNYQERYIHAWGKDKCIEYLKRAKNTIKE